MILQPRIALIGEAWGADEEAAGGLPFVGRAGRTLDHLLGVAGIDRAQCLVTNVIAARPPNNDLMAWCWSKREEVKHAKTNPEDAQLPPTFIKGKGEKFLKPEHRHHLSRMWDELRDYRPDVIVPLGGVALWGVLGPGSGIDHHRGTICSVELEGRRVKVCPTLHPARVLRQWKLFLTVAGDLARAKAEAERPEHWDLLEASPASAPTLGQIAAFADLAASPQTDLMAIDIETAAGQITCVGFCLWPWKQMMVVPFVGPPPANSYWPTEAEELKAWGLVRRLCGLPCPKVLQNGLYDTYWLTREAGICIRNYALDTRLLMHAWMPELPKSLGYMGQSMLRLAPWKHHRGNHLSEDKRDN